MCAHIKRDPYIADEFFFPETNNWENNQDGTFEPTWDYQLAIDLAIEQKNVVWIEGSRGSSKSSRTARAISKYLLRNANQVCKIIGPSFRQSKESYRYCLKYIRQNRGIANLPYNLDQDIPPDDIKEGIEQKFTMTNGSVCQALPGGKGKDGSTLRGQRATILWIEEAYLLDEHFMESHVEPFLNVEKGSVPNKLIFTTTADYQDSYAYSRLMDIAKKIVQGRKDHYIISITIQDVAAAERAIEPAEPEGTMPHFPAAWARINDQIERGTSENGILSDEVQMAYFNKWIKSAASFFRSDVLSNSKDPAVPLLERKPEAFAHQFVLGVDPAGQGSDLCEMAVGSLPGNDHRHINAIYKWAKQKPEEIAGHIHKMVDLYGMRLIVMDKTGTLGHTIADLCSREDQLIDGQWQKRRPITLWNHENEASARAHIVLTLPSDDKMVSGFIGPRETSTIQSEIELKNAMLFDVRSRLENGQLKVSAQELDEDDYYGDEATAKGVLLDNINEAVAQFRRIDRMKKPDGSLYQDTKGNYKFTRPSKDDGAFAITYCSWGANIIYKQAPAKSQEAGAIAIWDGGLTSYPVDDNGGWAPRPPLY